MSQPEKEICLLNDSFPPLIDGVANVVVNYAKILSDKNYLVSVVTPEHPEADDSAFPYPVIRYPSIDLRKSIGYTAGNPFSLPVLYHLKKRNISLLHSHCPIMSTILARILRGSMDVPLVVTYHTKFDIDIANTIKPEFLQQELIRALVENIAACDELWVVSEGAGKNIRSLGYQGDYTVIPNGVDMSIGRAPESKIWEVTKDYDLPYGIPLFLFVGRMMWYKGVRLILDALAAIKSQDFDFRMVFVGGGGDEEEIREYCTRLNLNDKCFFTGPIYNRDDLRAWYSAANLLLFPSSFDTNGLVVREAAACSLGAVLIRNSCASEGVTHRVDGLLVEENAASLAVCLVEIARHFDAMRQIGENARNNLYLSWEDAIQKAMKRYEYVMDKYKSGGYPKKKGIAAGLFQFQGNLLDALDTANEKFRELGSALGFNERGT